MYGSLFKGMHKEVVDGMKKHMQKEKQEHDQQLKHVREEELNRLYGEYYEACLNFGYYKAMADDLEEKIKMFKKENEIQTN